MREYNGPYNLVNLWGQRLATFPTLDIALPDWQWDNVVDDFPEKWFSIYWLDNVDSLDNDRRFKLRVVDVLGFAVPRHRIRRIRILPSNRWSRIDYDHEKDFRNGPLRGVAHHYKWWKRQRFFRNRGGSVMQEIRDQSMMDCDPEMLHYDIRVRAKRRNLPVSIGVWIDEPYRSRKGNNWKRYRRTQWRMGN